MTYTFKNLKTETEIINSVLINIALKNILLPETFQKIHSYDVKYLYYLRC